MFWSKKSNLGCGEMWRVSLKKTQDLSEGVKSRLSVYISSSMKIFILPRTWWPIIESNVRVSLEEIIMFKNSYGNRALNKNRVYDWFSRFENEELMTNPVQDAPPSPMSKNDENVVRERKWVKDHGIEIRTFAKFALSLFTSESNSGKRTLTFSTDGES